MRVMSSRRRATIAAVIATVGLMAGAMTVPATAATSNNNSRKLRDAVTVDAVMSHLNAFQGIADLAGGNRFAGLPGHDNSAQYVIRKLREAGYSPTVHAFTYEAFFERSPSTLEQRSPAPTTYVNGNDFRIMTYSGSGTATAALARPSGDLRGCYAADYAGFPAGSIAIVQRGTPAGFPGGSCTFRIKTDNARAAGAAAVLIFNNVPGVVNGTLSATGLSAIPSLGLTQSLGNALLAQMASGPVVVKATTDTGSQALPTYNVLAETPSGDPNNIVMVGSHLDSVTTGPGINDNGTGSAAILETAIQLARTPLRNKVRFAWWSAEESGLIGARQYVQSLPPAEGNKIALYLNFDMVGSPNFARFVYDGDASANPNSIPVGCAEHCKAGSDVIEEVFNGYFSQVAKLPAEPTPFNGRSDYGPFIDANIPAGGLFTGAEGVKTAAQAQLFGGQAGVAFDKCYHAACDTIANVNVQGLDQMTDAIAHAVITFAQNTESVNGVKGKGNFKSPPRSESGAGAGGGGGLHDDHDHEEA
jgi:Zn-dependent M28 family amino/carboxypeptidase